MGTPPDGYQDTLDVADMRRALGNDASWQKQKIRVEPKRGSQKYLHLQRFIEARRKKKRDKRCTLDPSAKVTFP